MRKFIRKLNDRYQKIKAHPLSSKNPFLGLLRYLSFNFVQNLFPRRRVYNWINGLKFYARKGDAGIVGNIYYGLMDYEESQFLLQRLKKDDLFVDVGANVGHYTLLAAGICKANVISIEPIPDTYEKLKSNINLNNLSSRIKLLNIGLSDKKGTLYFLKNKDVMNKVTYIENVNNIKVNVSTLNSILTDKKITFLKIDVEGFEFFVLKGANNILKQESLKYLIIEFNGSGQYFGVSDEEVFNYIKNFNFEPVTFDYTNNKVQVLESYNKNKFNTIFIKKNLIA